MSYARSVKFTASAEEEILDIAEVSLSLLVKCLLLSNTWASKSSTETPPVPPEPPFCSAKRLAIATRRRV